MKATFIPMTLTFLAASTAYAQDWSLYSNLPTLTFNNYLSVRGLAPKSKNKKSALLSAQTSCQEALEFMRIAVEAQGQMPLASRTYVSKRIEGGESTYEGDCDIRTLDLARLPSTER